MKRERHLYSINFREEYGRTLSRDEIRLIQAYRGMNAERAGLLLDLASRFVIERAQTGGAQ